MEKNMTGKICGTGSWAPDRVWDNNDLAKMVETSDQWIRERTGVVQRHIAKEDEDTVTMAAGAALRALEDAEMKAEEIDLILVATISPTEIMPCVACGVQERLGAENATCFDLNGACTGSLLALNTAQAYLAQGIYRNVLVIGAEKLSGLTDWTDRGTCILFGDGAGAVVLRAEFEPQGISVYPISAVTGQGVRELLFHVKELLDKSPKTIDNALQRIKNKTEKILKSDEKSY